ncbi:MAG TPA: hypothetical protein DD490_20735 [Acidobacteria bacterium]|nr:hypothetical protein [Acidobacteriota bacterium]
MRNLQIGAVAVAAALLAMPATADWLVTADGGRVETRGPWTVKGKLVVFTKVDGQLSSLRLADVDLAASEQATAEAAQAQETAEAGSAPPAEKKAARWVMTDKDFRSAPPPAPEAAEKPAAPETDQAGRPRLNIVVESWERKDLQDGLEIQGMLRNPSGELAAEVGVTVQLFDDAGSLLATGDGRIATSGLAAGAAVSFRAAFPGVFSFAEAKFETRGYGLRIKAAPPEGKDADGKPVSPGTAESPPGRTP